MKKLLVGLLACLVSFSYAHKVEVVNRDGYMPLVINPRIVFYVTKEYTDDLVAPKGTVGLFIVTVDCEKKLHRRTLTEIYYPNNIAKQLFNSDDAIANNMSGQKFLPIEPELMPITNNLCLSLIK